MNGIFALRIQQKIADNASSWNKSFIDKHAKNFKFISFDVEYLTYICSLIGVKSLTREMNGWLLSAVYKDINELVNQEKVYYNRMIVKFVDDSFKYSFMKIQKEWKHGAYRPLKDYYYNFAESTFETSRNILSANKSTNAVGAHYKYIGLKAIELVLLYKRSSFIALEEEERRRLREESQALKELKREKEQAEKDAAKAKAAIEKNEAALAKAKNEEQTQKLLNQIEELKLALARAEERRERALSMAQQTRCGYVYVISNIGSFGEGVYKIGMTRRVNPIDRVHELGDASVPFRFDVHAMIYTEDAPGLESALHRKFNDRRINLDNFKKEFFRVPLDEIRSEVESMGISTTWVDTPQAEQWRSSERQRNGNTSGSESFAYEYNPFEEFLD